VTAIFGHIVALMKSNQNFISPYPDAVVSGPAAESARLIANYSMPDSGVLVPARQLLARIALLDIPRTRSSPKPAKYYDR